MKTDKFQIGKIVNTHGIKGEVKILSFTEEMNQFDNLKSLYIGNEKETKKTNIISLRFHKNVVLIMFEGIDNMTKAEELKNKYVYIDRKTNKELPQNTYYVADLLGLEVLTTDNNNLGNIVDVFPTGSNDVYVVKNNESGKDVLLPAIKDVVKEINIDEKYMIINLLEGLI